MGKIMIKGPKSKIYSGEYRGGSFDDELAWRSHYMNREDFDAAVSVFVSQLTRYDAARLRLENQGGSTSILTNTMEILKEEFHVQGRYETHRIALTDQRSMRRVLQHELWPYECRLEVRRGQSGMPVYYLARVWPDYRAMYSLILEDLYRSTGYPISDERFVKIMRGGHEVYFLRLSQFREPLLKSGDPEKQTSAQDEMDTLLRKVGRHVFQACWHEDQYVGMAAAAQFDLVNFHRAIELLYLGLTAELCELRSAIDDAMLRFFKEVYVQPAVVAFLERLARLDGKALAEVPQAALKLFPRLSRTFNRFLTVDLPWGRKQAMVPLYKLLFANLSRLDTVCQAIAEKEELRQAADSLEKQSQAVIQALLDGAGDKGSEPDPALEQLKAVSG
jgi:hypothetical protein